MSHLTGLIAAAHTPLTVEGELALPVVAEQAALFSETGLTGVFVAGTTGESLSLSVVERQQLLETWCRAAEGSGLTVIAHVGHPSRPEATELARHAVGAGADAVAAMAPPFFRPEEVADLVGFLAPVAAAAVDLPFYYYDIPALTGVDLPTDEFLAVAAERIPNLAGVKFARDDPVLLRTCLDLDGGRFEVLFGIDEQLSTALAAGVRGAVGSTYNYAAPLYRPFFEAIEAGDEENARETQHVSVRLVEILSRFGVLRAGKEIMGLLGIDCGPPRSPLRQLSAGERRALYEDLRSLEEMSGRTLFNRPLRAPGA